MQVPTSILAYAKLTRKAGDKTTPPAADIMAMSAQLETVSKRLLELATTETDIATANQGAAAAATAAGTATQAVAGATTAAQAAAQTASQAATKADAATTTAQAASQAGSQAATKADAASTAAQAAATKADAATTAASQATTAAQQATTAAQQATTTAAAAVSAAKGYPGWVRLLDYINPQAPDHTAGFKAAVAAAKQLGFGAIHWRDFTGGTIKLSDEILITPDSGDRCHVGMQGNVNAGIQWNGPSSKNIFNMIGNCGVEFADVGFNRLPDGVANIYCVNLDTNSQCNSTTNLTFTRFGGTAGIGFNNSLFRLGHTSAGNGDVSNISLESCGWYGTDGGTQSAADGAKYATPGQCFLKSEGRNVINVGVKNALMAYLWCGVTTHSAAMAVDDKGNLIYMPFYGAPTNGAGGISITDNSVFSHNRQDVRWASVQALLIDNCRSEQSGQHLLVTDSSDSGIITMNNVHIDDATGASGFGDWSGYNGCVIACGRPSTIRMANCTARRSASAYQRLVGMGSSTGKPGALFIDGGSFTAVDNPYFLPDNVGKIYTRGAQILGLDGQPTGQFFTDRSGS